MPRGGNEFTFNLTGNKGLAAAGIGVLAVLFIGIRAMSLGESDDERLRTAVQVELMNAVGGEASRALENLDTSDPDAVAAFLETVDMDDIQVHSTRISRPLLSAGSEETVVVRVEYTLPGKARTSEYWRMRYSLAAGYRYLGRSSGLGYYLNLL